jgi:hypothetical protein
VLLEAASVAVKKSGAAVLRLALRYGSKNRKKQYEENRICVSLRD